MPSCIINYDKGTFKYTPGDAIFTYHLYRLCPDLAFFRSIPGIMLAEYKTSNLANLNKVEALAKEKWGDEVKVIGTYVPKTKPALLE